jgi:hypothetical protein
VVIACLILLVAFSIVVGRGGRWRRARWELLLGSGAIAGIWAMYFLQPRLPPELEAVLLVTIVVLGGAFVSVGTVRAFKAIARIGPRTP